MKTKHILLTLLMASTFLFSCKDKDVTTPTEERIEQNHPTEMDNEDTSEVMKDSATDENMKDQSVTDGRDVKEGK